MGAKQQLTNLFATGKERLKFRVADREFAPTEEDDAINVSDVIVECEPGMKSDQSGMCGKFTFMLKCSDLETNG